MMTTTTAVPPCLVEGLALDVSILQALLKRHRCNHGRTLYYRRMAMALRCLERSRVVESLPLLDALQSQANRYQQEKVRKRNLNRKRQRNEAEEEEWTLTPTTATTTTTMFSDGSRHHSVLSDLIHDWQMVVHIWTVQTEEVLSRIHHASCALFIEVSRGFFVPFCSVGLATLARIRAMIMEIGQISLVQLYDLKGEVFPSELGNDNEKTIMTGVVNLTEGDYQHYMGLFVDEQQSTSGTLDVTTIGRKPDTNDILATLGLSPPHPPTGKKPSRQNDTGKMVNAMGESSRLPITNALEEDDVMGIDHYNRGSDVGEADVNVSSAGTPPLHAKNSGKNKAATHTTQLDESVDSQFREEEMKQKIRRVKPFHQVDGNESKTGTKKRKTDPEAVETGKTKKKKKSKSKKTSKGNFFDDLFG